MGSDGWAASGAAVVRPVPDRHQKNQSNCYTGKANAAGRLQVPSKELALLKTLRNQAVLAIKPHAG